MPLSSGVNVAEGGVPLVIDGKIIGANGESGVNPDQDSQVAKAGVDVVAAK